MERCSLGMEGLANARQLGAYVAEDGRRVREAVLLRSAKLIGASQADLERLQQVYRLRTIVDFRTSSEAASAPDPEMDGVKYIRLQVLDEAGGMGQAAKAIPGASVDLDATVKGMLELVRKDLVSEHLYIDQLDTDIAKAGYRCFFDLLLGHEDGAILWHCTSGKDRTGVAAVLVLAALGVDKETILHDFELSNQFHAQNLGRITRAARRFTSDPDELEAILSLAGVSRKYMEQLFSFAERRHGSMISYIQQEIGVADAEIQALRNKYLA